MPETDSRSKPEAWWESSIDYAAITNLGMQRSNNQDSHIEIPAASGRLWRDRGHFFMVADGMGAHAAGERASELAVLITSQSYMKRTKQSPYTAIRDAIQDAHLQIRQHGEEDDAFRSMGTTADVLLLLPEGAVNAHVGDSRTYRLRGGRYEQLTFDHSLLWELTRSGNANPQNIPASIPKNIITRSLGPGANPKVDLEGPFPLQKGDVFLLCSDGLSGQVSDSEMAQVLSLLPPAEAAPSLVNLTNLSGGPDNVTLIIVKILGVPSPGDTVDSKSTEKRAPIPPLGWGVLVAAIAFLLTAFIFIPVLPSKAWSLLPLTASLGLFGGFLYLARRALFPSRPLPRSHEPFGKGPYTQTPAAYTPEFAKKLLRYCERLEDALAPRISAEVRAENSRLLAQSRAAFDRKNYRESIFYALKNINGGYGVLNHVQPVHTSSPSAPKKA